MIDLSRLNPLKPFRRSKEEVIWFLDTVLHGKMDCRAWDSFVKIPIGGDREMEAIRKACAELEAEEIIDDDGRLHHKAEARGKLEALRANLKGDPNQAR